METERSRKIQELYHAAVELAPEPRAALLAQAGPDLRREVESLLRYGASCTASGELLARPMAELAAGLLEAAAPPRIGNYRILSTLGSGGMGVVYRAEQEHPRRIVALKVMLPGWSNPELLDRFERESHVLGRLQHPGIAQVYEAGNTDFGAGLQPYFAMEFIEGQSLLEYAEAHRRTTRARLGIMLKICDAVHHAHRRGIIHRDLKPGNILVDNTGQPKILDFGVACMTDGDAQLTRQTCLGQLVGTLAYMSPEQVLGDPLELDTRSDVYALGVVLYQLLAGRLPYTLGPSLPQVVQTIRETDPVPLSSISQNYRGDVETIAAKALEKDKTRRYSTAADLAADIRRYLDDEPIAARPPSAGYHLRKFARRHRLLVAGLAAVFLTLTTGVVASTWQAVRANRAGRIAVAERKRHRSRTQSPGRRTGRHHSPQPRPRRASSGHSGKNPRPRRKTAGRQRNRNRKGGPRLPPKRPPRPGRRQFSGRPKYQTRPRPQSAHRPRPRRRPNPR
jgi:serine/threonine protein kinase